MNTYTEKEAKSKWCPFTRVYGSQRSINRTLELMTRDTPPEIPSTTLCLGSGCMAWR